MRWLHNYTQWIPVNEWKVIWKQAPCGCRREGINQSWACACLYFISIYQVKQWMCHILCSSGSSLVHRPLGRDRYRQPQFLPGDPKFQGTAYQTHCLRDIFHGIEGTCRSGPWLPLQSRLFLSPSPCFQHFAIPTYSTVHTPYCFMPPSFCLFLSLTGMLSFLFYFLICLTSSYSSFKTQQKAVCGGPHL